MATLQELIDRATDIASGAIDGPLQDAEMLAQSLLPEVLHEEASKAAKDPQMRTIYKKTHAVAVTAGVGNLPAEAFSAYLCEADVIDTNGDNASWCRWASFVRPLDPRLAWFAAKEGTTLGYLPVGGGSYTGNISVTVATAPTIPALSTDQVVMPEEILDDVIRSLAEKMVISYKSVA